MRSPRAWAADQLAPLIGSPFHVVMTVLAMLAGGGYREAAWDWFRQFYLALPGEHYWWPVTHDTYAWVLGGRPGALRVAVLPRILVVHLHGTGATLEQLRAYAELYGRRDVMRVRRSP